MVYVVALFAEGNIAIPAKREHLFVRKVIPFVLKFHNHFQPSVQKLIILLSRFLWGFTITFSLRFKS